jgi:hypothetical protein
MVAIHHARVPMAPVAWLPPRANHQAGACPAVKRLVVIAIAAALVAVLGVVELRSGEGVQPSAQGGPAPRLDAVLYGIGVSSDPYGSSRPRGIGVAREVARGAPTTTELRRRRLRADGWLAPGHVLAVTYTARHFPRYELLRVGGDLRRAPLPRRALNPRWSPDQRWIAYQLALRCRAPNPRASCYRPSRRTFVSDAARPSPPAIALDGQAVGWTPAGRLVIPRGGDLQTVGLRDRRRTTLLSKAEVARATGAGRGGWLSAPIWSPDGRYLAVQAHLVYSRARERVGTIVVATAAGRIVRSFHSPYVVSMVAWSPRGHRLAWTTSGFPAPHELVVADLDKDGAQRRLLVTNRHFDWITWSPDGRRLLLDDEHHGDGSWRLLDADRANRGRTLARLGGQPLWCCPQNALVTAGGAWSGGVR